jgi:hypothetical protein
MRTTRAVHVCVRIVAAVAIGAGLASCGGDPHEAASVTISGTAARGAVLPGAAVSVRCAAGAGGATAGSDGAYTTTINDVRLPCVLRAIGTEGSTFHSIVAGTGSSGTHIANISPLTEMMVAQLAEAPPASYYNAFGSSSTVSATQVTAAIAYIEAALAPVVSLGGVNPLTDALVAGNPLDLKIETVMAGLASAGLTLEQVTGAIAANPEAPDVVAWPLAPTAASCTWLKSGKYRMISLYETDPQWQANVLELDAEALTIRLWGDLIASLVDNGGCKFSVDGADALDAVSVSSGGLLVVHSQSKAVATDRSVMIGLPAQALPVSEFAGTWSIAGWAPTSEILKTGYVAQTDEIGVDASGQVTAISRCLGLAACAAEGGPFPVFVANTTDGGFDMTVAGVRYARAFHFKTLAGKAVFVAIGADGQFSVGARKEPLGTLPAVGTVTDYREFDLLGNGSISALFERTVSVIAVDAGAKTVTRIRSPDNRVDTLAFDKPRAGLRYRAADSCSVNGLPAGCAETVQLPLQGMGVTVSLSVGTEPSTAFYSVSTNKPAP